jgi:hypothetical protein
LNHEKNFFIHSAFIITLFVFVTASAFSQVLNDVLPAATTRSSTVGTAWNKYIATAEHARCNNTRGGKPFIPYTNTGTMLSTCPSEQVYVYPAVLCEQGAVLQGEWQVSGCTVSTPTNTCGIVTAPSGIYASFTLKYRFRTGGGWSAWGPILYAGTRNCAAGEEPYSIGFGFGSSSSSSSIGISQSSAAIYIQLEQTEQQAGLRSASVSRPSSEIRLYNIYGTLVRTLTSQEGTAEINTSNLPDGIYFLYVFRGNAENPYIQTLRIKH